MEIRFQHSANEVKSMSSESLRQQFLFESLMKDDMKEFVYTHYDRMIVGGVKPVKRQLILEPDPELKADYFLERREMGIINTGGKGSIRADGVLYELEKLSCLYLGRQTMDVLFQSADPNNPALFFCLSALAHHHYPNRLMHQEEVIPVKIGDAGSSSQRSLYKYIHAGGIPGCQLVMGLTVLEPGSVWNSVPPHTHTRRMEVYFYFDLPVEQRVFHFMGEPSQTRHLLVGNNQAVLSPPWSIHCGCGTSNYAFVWGMAGENDTFTDMDTMPVTSLR